MGKNYSAGSTPSNVLRRPTAALPTTDASGGCRALPSSNPPPLQPPACSIQLQSPNELSKTRSFPFAMSVGKHVDIAVILEDYAWRFFKDIQSIRKTRNDDFRNLEREDVEFEVVRNGF
uniref:Uncharacterized protein n=1 Tax=Plectus sambesii TaxID=2011161 RepID=A0A914V6Q1_9BILA